MKRRSFVQTTSLGLASCAWAAKASTPPIGLIYSNDTTHILSCQRPEERTAFTRELLEKSITEAAGADAHFLQPGLGWIPYWTSEIYSIEDHYRWLRDAFGVKGTRRIEQFLLNGGDLLATLVETCRGSTVAPFLSFRLNDGHHVRDLAMARERGRPTQGMSRFYWENYERFRIGPDTKNWDDGVFDWSNAEVRDHKFALIEEACSRYDLAGLELDFLRHWVRFGPTTDAEARFVITTDFVRRIRKMLGPDRRLCVRVPAVAEVRPEQGIDIGALADVGVDMINLSWSYFTWQDDNVAKARAEVGDRAAIYAEMTHTTMTGKATAGSGTQPFLRTTDEQFHTTARLADQEGAAGVSLFNFPYYRYHVTDTIGPFHEPPFHVLPLLKDRDVLDNQAEWYFLSSGRNDRILGERQLPAILKRAQAQTFRLQMLRDRERRSPGHLRLRSDEPINDREIEVRFNGVLLRGGAAKIPPSALRYQQAWQGKPEEMAGFALPADVTTAESNEVEVLVRKGERVRLIYLDVIFP